MRQLTRSCVPHLGVIEDDRRNHQPNGDNGSTDDHSPSGYDADLAARTVYDVGLAVVALSHQ